MNFLLESFFSSSWFLILLLVVAVGLLMLTSFSRRKKEEQYRSELNEKMVKGTKVRTIGGVYGTIVSVRNTTDGKIILIETGEGDKKSYMNFHINAILDVTQEEDVVIDENGNEIALSEYNKQQELKTQPAVAPVETPAETTEKAEEPKTEEVEKPKKSRKTKQN